MEHAEGSVVIEAPLEDVMEVIEDYESYPEWSEVQTVDIRQRGEGGRAYEVAYEVDVPVLGKAAYTLACPTLILAARMEFFASIRLPSAI